MINQENPLTYKLLIAVEIRSNKVSKDWVENKGAHEFKPADPACLEQIRKFSQETYKLFFINLNKKMTMSIFVFWLTIIGIYIFIRICLKINKKLFFFRCVFEE
jgi:hypothetical protein